MKNLNDMLECWQKNQSPAELTRRFKEMDPADLRASAEEEAAAFEALREIEAALETYVGTLTVEKDKIARMLMGIEKSQNACIAYVKGRSAREDIND